MKKIAMLVSSVALVASCLMMAGCSTSSGADADTTPVGAPALMPESHEGRFERLGANGCYGCHGSSETAEVLLVGATPLPADHYVNGDVASYEFDPNRAECLTCHSQG